MNYESDPDHHIKMNDEKESLLPPKRPPLFNFSISFEQLMFVIIMILPALPPGMSVGFSAIAIPELHLNLMKSSWFASLPTLGSLLGTLLTGYIIDRYGRKLIFFTNTIPAFIGYIFLAGPPNIVYLYIGQLCLGVAQGAVPLVATVYIAESMVPDNLHFRSSITSWNITGMTTGVALTYFLGYLLRYDHVALVGASLAFISSILVLVFIPESPAWLDQQGRYKEAEQARYQLGSKKFDVEPSAGYQPITDTIYIRDNFSTYLEKIKRKNVYKPLLITVAYFFFQQFSGIQVYYAYMVDFIAVESVTIDSYLTTLISGLIMIMGQIAYTFLLPQIGLRKIAIISSIIASLSTLLLGICINLSETVTWYSNYVDYIHILSVWCNVFVSSIGIGTIPFAIVGEIFPTDAKGFASVPLFCVTIFYFINLMVYPQAKVLSTYAIYYVYSVIGFLAIPFIYYYVPETVGRTLGQISTDFSSK